MYCLLLLGLLSLSRALLIPKAIKAGDTIGFITPASTVGGDQSAFRSRVETAMASLSLRVRWGTYAFGPASGYLAATDQHRADDVMSMFTNKSIAGIISTRGGWGTNRLLELLDYTVIAANPKFIMGYSDLTGLTNAIHTRAGLLTFHGPMGIDGWPTNGWNMKYFSQVAMKAQKVTFEIHDGTKVTTIVPGKATGRLIGGNLSVFVAMFGSKFLDFLKGPFILFLEDVGEASYRVDRMLTQVVLSGLLNQCSGVVWGHCSNCDESGFTVQQILQQKFGNLSIPVFSGAMFGHISQQYTLPIGGLVQIDANKGTITMLEPGVQN